MDSLQRKVNLFHYNIWRFERWTRYLLFGERRLTTIQSNVANELEDIVPFAVDSVDESMLPNYSGKHLTVLVYLVLLSILNVIGMLFGFSFSYFWFWGAIVCGIIGFLASWYLTPMPLRSSETNVLLEDFKIFESMSDSRKRLSGIITFLIVCAVWSTSITSFAYYLKSLIDTR